MRQLMPYQPPAPPRGAGAKRQFLIGTTIFLALFLIVTNTPLRGLLDSGWGWVALVTAVLLWNLLGRFRPREWARVLVTGGVGALLLVALVTAATTPTLPARPKPHRPPAQAEAPVDLEELRGKVIEGWQQLASGFSKYTTTPPTQEGR